MTVENLRKYRIGGIAIFDLSTAFIGTILISVILWRLFFKEKDLKYFILFGAALTIPLGIIVHKIFGIKTTLNYDLGISEKP